MEYTLFIRGPLRDLSDVLHIARVEGRRYLNTKKVIVKPIVEPYNEGYLVVVEPDGSSCGKASIVGGEKAKNK